MARHFIGAEPLSEIMLDYVNSTLEKRISIILIEIRAFSFKKMHLKISFAEWCPFLSWPQCVNSYNTVVIVELALRLLMAWYLWHQGICSNLDDVGHLVQVSSLCTSPCHV